MVLLVPCADEASDHHLVLLPLHGLSYALLVGPFGAQVTTSSLVSDYWLKPAVKVYCFYLYFCTLSGRVWVQGAWLVSPAHAPCR